MNLSYYQDSFEGGMNMVLQDTKIATNQYRVGLNVRSRFGPLECVRGPVLSMEDLPVIYAIQGFYNFGVTQVLFADGVAYYRVLGTTDWALISDFTMGSAEETIYAQAVPQASRPHLRINLDGTFPTAGIALTDATSGSDVALVVQDGVNQPWLIYADGTAEEASDYTAWNKDTNRQYIPIGKQMTYFNGILFIVSADGKSIYRSVSGRPLDFVVAINNTGDKVADATSTSFAVDANEIKLIDKLNDNALLIVTSYAGWAVSLRFDNLIYGEPTFDQIFLFTAGAMNQFSGTDSLGDYVFIDKEGLKSFNAVTQLKNEGNQSVFSLSVAELFKNIEQVTPCLGVWDNYVFFAVKTIYSASSVLVFDAIKKVFVSVDILGIGTIKQFATTYAADSQRLFAVTSNKVYELYTGAGDIKTAVVFPRSLNSKNSDLGPTINLEDLKLENIKMMFERGVESGNLIVTALANDRVYDTYRKTLTEQVILGFFYPVTAPVIARSTNANFPVNITAKGTEGQKLSFVLTWSGGAKLAQMIFTASSKADLNTKQQQAR